MKVTVVNLKGGSGKTLTSFFLATALAGRGRTLVVDADPQGSALSWAAGAEEEGGALPFAVVGLPTRDVHRRLKLVAADYEHVVIDTPPGELGIARSALMAADVALVAVPPTPIDLDRMIPTLELVADVEDMTNLSLYVLLTRVRRISREGRDAREAMREMELPLLATEIPALRFYSEAFGRAVGEAGDYENVARELLGEEVVS